MYVPATQYIDIFDILSTQLFLYIPLMILINALNKNLEYNTIKTFHPFTMFNSLF